MTEAVSLHNMEVIESKKEEEPQKINFESKLENTNFVTACGVWFNPSPNLFVKLFVTFKKLFDKLTPTRAGVTENIIYIYYDEVYDDDAVTGLLYRPNTRQLVIYPNYFISLRMFISSKILSAFL